MIEENSLDREVNQREPKQGESFEHRHKALRKISVHDGREGTKSAADYSDGVYHRINELVRFYKQLDPGTDLVENVSIFHLKAYRSKPMANLRINMCKDVIFNWRR
mmetsp:Transcript_297/g.510  ORF Transcript_297/g.510 Transcript_297/m.510 type:complete len:106 (-) Transcript_297:457-774(-)